MARGRNIFPAIGLGILGAVTGGAGAALFGLAKTATYTAMGVGAALGGATGAKMSETKFQEDKAKKQEQQAQAAQQQQVQQQQLAAEQETEDQMAARRRSAARSRAQLRGGLLGQESLFSVLAQAQTKRVGMG